MALPAPLCSHREESVNLSLTEPRNKIVVCSVAFVQGKHLGPITYHTIHRQG